MSTISRSNWVLIASLYTTQALALMFFVGAFVAILREQDASLDKIGLIYMLGMIWPFKFLWAPLIDRYSLKRFGHYRFWLMLLQGAMVVTLLLMASYDPATDFAAVYALCLVLSLLSATQDVATDGLICRLLPAAERGIGNGLQITGGLLATALGGGVALIGYDYLQWSGTMLALAAVTSTTVLQLIGFSEPAWPTVTASVTRLFRHFWAFWQYPGRYYWLAVLLLYSTGSSLAYAVLIPMLVDAGWALDRIGLLVNIIGPITGVLSAMAAGWVINRIDRRTAMIGAAVLQMAGIMMLALLLTGSGDGIAVMVSVAVYYLFYNPAAVVLATLMMDQVSAESPATDYALQFGVHQFFALGMISAGALLAERLGYSGVIVTATLAAVLAVMLSLRYRDHARPAEQAASRPAGFSP